MKRLLTALVAGLFTISAVQAEVGDSLISPDGKWKGSGPTVSSSAGDYESSELWQTDSRGGNRTLLASTHNDDDVRYLVAQFNDLKFSSDGRLLYFDTPARGNISGSSCCGRYYWEGAFRLPGQYIASHTLF
jgi:hypothetical protein